MLNLSLTYVCILTFFQIPFYKQRLLWYHEMVNLVCLVKSGCKPTL